MSGLMLKAGSTSLDPAGMRRKRTPSLSQASVKLRVERASLGNVKSKKAPAATELDASSISARLPVDRSASASSLALRADDKISPEPLSRRMLVTQSVVEASSGS